MINYSPNLITRYQDHLSVLCLMKEVTLLPDFSITRSGRLSYIVYSYMSDKDRVDNASGYIRRFSKDSSAGTLCGESVAETGLCKLYQTAFVVLNDIRTTCSQMYSPSQEAFYSLSTVPFLKDEYNRLKSQFPITLFTDEPLMSRKFWFASDFPATGKVRIAFLDALIARLEGEVSVRNEIQADLK